jgi:hypothetical protein
VIYATDGRGDSTLTLWPAFTNFWQLSDACARTGFPGGSQRAYGRYQPGEMLGLRNRPVLADDAAIALDTHRDAAPKLRRALGVARVFAPAAPKRWMRVWDL